MVLAGFHGKYVNWLKPFFIERASHEKTFCLKNGTPHSRYFSDELGVPIFSKNAELVFAIYRNIWYNFNMEKEIFTIKENTLSYGRGYVYSL